MAAATAAGSIVVAERQVGRDHRHIAQRQRVERRHEDRRAGDLHGVLRGADHGGADARVRPRQLQAARREPRAQFGGELRAEIAEALGLAAINIFRDAAGEAHVDDVAAIASADRAAAGRRRRRAASRRAWLRTIGRPSALRARGPVPPSRRCPAPSVRPSSAPKRRPASSSRTMRRCFVEHDEPRADYRAR